MSKFFISKLLVVFVTGIFFAGCESESSESVPVAAQEDVSKLESAMNDLQSKYDALRQRKPTEAIDWAADDLKSIGDWEYKVIEVSGLSIQGLEKQLNELGQERWQVFWVKETDLDSMLVMLKRPTISYLSKLPLSSLGKMMLDDEGQ